MLERQTKLLESYLWLRCNELPIEWNFFQAGNLFTRRCALLGRYILRINKFRKRSGKLPASLREANQGTSPLGASPLYPTGEPEYRIEADGFQIGDKHSRESQQTVEIWPEFHVRYSRVK
jgi:hypothetical protein